MNIELMHDDAMAGRDYDEDDNDSFVPRTSISDFLDDDPWGICRKLEKKKNV